MTQDPHDPIDVARFHVVSVARVLVSEERGFRPRIALRERLRELDRAVAVLEAAEQERGLASS